MFLNTTTTNFEPGLTARSELTLGSGFRKPKCSSRMCSSKRFYTPPEGPSGDEEPKFRVFWEYINDFFSTEDVSVVTQLPLIHHQGTSVTTAHIVVAFALYALQLHYSLLGMDKVQNISFWLLVTANAMACVFGSCRGFDRVTLVELFLAAFFSFFFRLHYAIPVIAIMTYQVYIRYEYSYLDSEFDENGQYRYRDQPYDSN
ncbi:unnamed protein product [Caenorhabditis sp. 36 PRJEB53466]|nr:unnamed protein product [Caenorhabditis sp. 36 PRJEB53466]